MLRDIRILQEVAGSAWMMHQPVLDAMVGVIMRHATGDTVPIAEVDAIVAQRSEGPEAWNWGVDAIHVADLEPQSFRGDGERPKERGLATYTVHGSVARIPIPGVLAKRSHSVNGTSQPRGTSYDAIRAMLQHAASNPDVSSIMLHIESPGGAALGCQALANEIFRIRESGIPVVSYYDDLAASAALYLGSQANKVYATQEAIVGSIGTKVVAWDMHEHFKDLGVKVHVVATGPMKGAFEPGTVITEEQLAKLQKDAINLKNHFVEAVARGRGMTIDAVQKLATGDTWPGDEAIGLGLVDEIAETPGGVIARMEEDYGGKRKQGREPVVRGSQERRGSSIAPTPAAGSIVEQPNAAHITPAEPERRAEETIMTGRNSKSGSEGAEGGAPAVEKDKGGGDADADDKINAALEEHRAGERKRIEQIEALAGKYSHVDGIDALSRDLIRDGVDVESAEQRIYKAAAEANRPTNKENVELVGEGRDRFREDASLALLSTNDTALVDSLDDEARGEHVARALGFANAVEARTKIRKVQSGELAGLSVRSLAMDCIARNPDLSISYGQADRMDPGEMFKAATHSSSDFPGILSNIAQKELLGVEQEHDPFWRDVARKGSSNNFQDSKIYQISNAVDLELVPEGKEPREASFSEKGESIAVQPYARKIKFTMQMLTDDNLGAFMEELRLLGTAGGRLPDRLIVALLLLNNGLGPTMSDGKTMFHADHNNLANPATALSYDTVRAARKAMRKQKSFHDGLGEQLVPIYVEGKILLVPVDLEDIAEDLSAQEYVKDPAGDHTGNLRNQLRGKVKPQSTPYFADDSTKWWLFADPRKGRPAFQVNFLKGIETSRINPIGNGSMLFQEWEIVLMGVGASGVSHQSGYHNAGN